MLSQRTTGVFVMRDYSSRGPSANYDIAIVKQRLSAERFARYEAIAGGLAPAVELYEWNMRAAAEFHRLLHGVEVILRNALHEQMSGWHHGLGLPGMWFDDPLGLLEAKAHDDIAVARRRIVQQGRVVAPGRLVSELTFGFWRYLLAGRYETQLWTPALRHAFPHLATRRRADVARPVERLHHLRNRIAHHEPIYPRRLDLDERDALAVVAAICGESRNWLEGIGSVAGVLDARPSNLGSPN
ncbi:MAG TPA: hypothetical protein VF062_06815 [Candidatus Limnocylindrales bacterium]